MSEHHVVLRVARGDKHDVAGAIVLSLDAEGDDAGAAIRQSRLWEGLARQRLQPPQVAIDLYRICAAAYCADLRIARGSGYDGWTRNIVLHVPVADLQAWAPHVETLAELLRFLSGDRWDINLREQDVGAPAVRKKRNDDRVPTDEPKLDAVCLFSGGLDSFVGAADAAAGGLNVLLVSHVPEGISRWITPAQNGLRSGLARAYPELRVEHLPITLNPPRVSGNMRREPSQRARSCLFLALGTIAAAAMGGGTPLIVPENGFISLNLPLTPGRLGSLSTRTTHPYVVHLYRKLLRGVGINVPLELPFMFATKGEMLQQARDAEVVHDLARQSNSCANPNPRKAAPEAHCGYCVPCIIRRAALSVIGLDERNDYRTDVLRANAELSGAQNSHLNAFLWAIRRRAGGVSLPDLLTAGPLPRSIGTIAEFRSVHDRGLAEVAAFLGAEV